MNINIKTMNSREFGVIENDSEFILIINGVFFGPFETNKHNIQILIDLLSGNKVDHKHKFKRFKENPRDRLYN
ncbi:hypothetical protein [Robertmurraya massiliosenegalensis]|uniref:hypothetical protein n=1 Tax=Robertmurraya massiliosenegalensis TaxID=1287657 RepID=UPI0002D9CF74|nr:hypothetical protein [Robertmurraya massiliosenegalensis]